ncbi:MAG TPA: hypothetical protein VE085_09940 [Burkholderiales bacterium]|nr:hypothetical protein [Burkholderiales bacterium]
MAKDEALAYDFCDELARTKGVSGYFATVSMVLNVAHTPRAAAAELAPLKALPM